MEKTVEIVQSLLDWIKNSPNRENLRLPSEAELCEKYGTTRMTVREALKILQYFNILKSVRGSGYSVVSESTNFSDTAEKLLNLYHFSYKDISEVREALELKVITLIQKNGCSQEDINYLQSCIDEMERQGENAVRADQNFHHKLANLSGNHLIVAISNALARAIQKYIEKYWCDISNEPSQTRNDLLESHKGILQLITDKKTIQIHKNPIMDHYTLSMNVISPTKSPEPQVAGTYAIYDLINNGWSSEDIGNLARELEQARASHDKANSSILLKSIEKQDDNT